MHLTMEQKFVFENDIVQWSVKIFVVFYSHFAFFHSWLHIPSASHDAFALVPKWSIILKKKSDEKADGGLVMSLFPHDTIPYGGKTYKLTLSYPPSHKIPRLRIWYPGIFFKTSMLIHLSLDFFLKKPSSLHNKNFHLLKKDFLWLYR